MNILLTSVGRRTYLVEYFKEALGGNGTIHVANSSSQSPAFKVADYSVVTPLIYDKTYIPFLLTYCKERKIDALISLFDIDLPVLSRNKKQFRDIGTEVVVSDVKTIDICNDKWHTYRYLCENQIAAPKTYITIDDSIHALEAGEIQFPVMLKPRWGMGSIGVFEAETMDELKVLYAKTSRSIQKSYLKYESAVDLDHSVLIQEKLNGQEHGLDVINDLEGNYITTIPKIKYAMRAGETDCAITVSCQPLMDLGERLSRIMHHVANLDVDVFKVDDKYYVLEMNARFGGGYPFSHLAGVNLPLAIVKWLQKQEVDKEVLHAEANVIGQKDIVLTRLDYLS